MKAAAEACKLAAAAAGPASCSTTIEYDMALYGIAILSQPGLQVPTNETFALAQQ